MRKAIALSLLLLANITLLAHAVIPHHHHDNEEVTCSSKCCFIDDDYTFANNNIKTGCYLHEKCNCGQAFYALNTSAFNIRDFIDDTIIHFRQNPYIPLFFSEYVSQSSGLRAPPVC